MSGPEDLSKCMIGEEQRSYSIHGRLPATLQADDDPQQNIPLLRRDGSGVHHVKKNSVNALNPIGSEALGSCRSLPQRVPAPFQSLAPIGSAYHTFGGCTAIIYFRLHISYAVGFELSAIYVELG